MKNVVIENIVAAARAKKGDFTKVDRFPKFDHSIVFFVNSSGKAVIEEVLYYAGTGNWGAKILASCENANESDIKQLIDNFGGFIDYWWDVSQAQQAPKGGKHMLAKYPGKCSKTGAKIEVGDNILYFPSTRTAIKC